MKKRNTNSPEIVVDSNIREISQDRFLDRIAWMLTKTCFSDNSGLFIVPKDIKTTLQPITDKS